MSIYIKGIQMPKTYPLTVTIYPDGQVLSETVGAKDIHGDAISVLPHGDLIDRDALMKGEGRYIISFGKEGIDVAKIYRALTIIPSSKEKIE